MKIAILDDYQDAVRQLQASKLLAEHEVQVLTESYSDSTELAQRIQDADALVLIRERTVITAELLAQLPKLKLISQTGKISNHLDLDTCSRAGVAVAEGVGSPVAPSELCWALVMAASRHLPAYAGNLAAGRWQDSGSLGLGRTLQGLTFGIWGYGKIGQRVARYAQAFGMQVLIWGREPSRQRALDDGFAVADSRAALFEQSDVLSLHLRLNDSTRGLVRQEDLARMKTDALLVNISRAELIEPGALPAALAAGRPGYAAVDVFEQEPPRAETEPLLNMPNVLCTPHIGYVERNSYELYFRTAFENVVSFFAGRPENIANPEVLKGS